MPLLYFFAINALFASVNTTLANTLFALGRSKIILNLMIFWTILSWLLTILLVKTFGFIGVGIASALVAASTSLVIYYAKKELPLNIAKNISGPLISSVAMFAIVKVSETLLPENIIGLMLMVLLGILSYGALSMKLLKQNLISEAKIILKALR